MINIETTEPIVININTEGRHTSPYVVILLESNRWLGRKEYAVISGVEEEDLDIDNVREWVENTYYEWDYEMELTSDFYIDNTDFKRRLNNE